MEVFIYFALFISVVVSTPANRVVPQGEYDEDFRRFIYVEKEGQIQLVDLKSENITYKAVLSDVTYYLYTNSNPGIPTIIKNGDISALASSNFDSRNLSLFIAHGWNNEYSSAVNQYIREATLSKYDVNVFVIDWSGPANKNYITAKNAVVDVGKFVGEFINLIQTQYGLSGDSFVLTGHSLGAHVVGNAGAVVQNKVAQIIGLDPASPLFTTGNIDNRIDPTDGKFVEIIHTNGNLLGFSTAIGDVDYFPNGGNSQPGCGLDLAGTCAHSRAYQYFAESISRGSVFESVVCDSYKNFEKGSCGANSRSFMGAYSSLLTCDISARGNFYLDTSSDTPYGLGQV